MIGEEPLSKARCTIGVLRDLYLPSQGYGKCPSVEEFMMQDAQRESIGFNVGTACLIPLDVGGFDPKDGFPQADIKPTNGTRIPVHGEQIESCIIQRGFLILPVHSNCSLQLERKQSIDL